MPNFFHKTHHQKFPSAKNIYVEGWAYINEAFMHLAHAIFLHFWIVSGTLDHRMSKWGSWIPEWCPGAARCQRLAFLGFQTLDKLSFFDKGAAPTGSNSALIWRFPVAGSQVSGGWRVGFEWAAGGIDSWYLAIRARTKTTPKIRKNKKSTVDGRLSRTTPSM